jgi:endonuclease-3
MPKRSRSITPTLSKPVSSSANANGVASGSGTELAATPLNKSPQKSKKLKLLSTYASKSPFPDWAHPTPEEAKSVHAVLCEAHPQYAGKRVAPREENDAAKTCGKGEFLARFGYHHLGDE